jgi:translation initiation factor IF-1
MNKEFQNTKIGIVIENLSNNRFKIELDDGSTVQAYLSGKMRIHHIRINIGDRIEFVVDSLGPNNRIIRRL